jgi:hypothetical protein
VRFFVFYSVILCYFLQCCHTVMTVLPRFQIHDTWSHFNPYCLNLQIDRASLNNEHSNDSDNNAEIISNNFYCTIYQYDYPHSLHASTCFSPLFIYLNLHSLMCKINFSIKIVTVTAKLSRLEYEFIFPNDDDDDDDDDNNNNNNNCQSAKY